ncbi:MAG: hypothetical protein ACQETL_00075 [Bacteroidota bacterium]
MNSYNIHKIITESGGYIELVAVLLSILFLVFLIKLVRIKSPELVVPSNRDEGNKIAKQNESTSRIPNIKKKPSLKMKSLAHRRRKPTIYKPQRTKQTEKTFSK